MYWPAHWYVFSEHDTKKKKKELMKHKMIKIGSAMRIIGFLSSYAPK